MKKMLLKAFSVMVAVAMVFSMSVSSMKASTDEWDENCSITFEGCYSVDSKGNKISENPTYTGAQINELNASTTNAEITLVITNAKAFQESLENMALTGTGRCYLQLSVKYEEGNLTLGSDKDPIYVEVSNTGNNGWKQGGYSIAVSTKKFSIGFVNQIPDSITSITGWHLQATKTDTDNLLPTIYEIKNIRSLFATNGYTSASTALKEWSIDGEDIGQRIKNSIAVDNENNAINNRPRGIFSPATSTDLYVQYTFDIAPITEGYDGNNFTISGGLTTTAGTLQGKGTQTLVSTYTNLTSDPNSTSYKADAGYYTETTDIDTYAYAIGTGLSATAFARGTNTLDASIQGSVGSRAYGNYGTALPTSFGSTTNPFNADTENGYSVDYVDITVYDPATGALKEHQKLNETDAITWLTNNTLGGRTEVRVAYTKTTTIDVTKIWTGLADDTVLPETIDVEVYNNASNGSTTTPVKTITLTAADLADSVDGSTDITWKTTITDLPESIMGIAAEYSIKEPTVSGYKTEITGSATDGYVITNTKIAAPQTGDYSSVAFLALGASVATLAAAFVVSKSGKKED